MKVERTETVDKRGMQFRLQQLRAAYVPERSTAGKQAHWTGTYQRWIIVTSAGRGLYRLDFYKDCPC